MWKVNITCIRLAHGFANLGVVMDWARRYVLSWELSNTLDSRFCVEALRRALCFSKPEVFNTDQGVQFRLRVYRATRRDEGKDKRVYPV